MVPISSGPGSTDSRFVRLITAGEAGLLLLAWALARWLDLSPMEQLRPSLVSVGWGIAATGPLLIGLSWALGTSWGPARRLVALVAGQLRPLLLGCSTAQLGLLAALAGISEEVLFRGVVQVGLSRAVPELQALLFTSVLFGLVHFASRTYAVLAGVMGLYLGALFLLQETLLAPIVTHSLYDFVALIYLVRGPVGTRYVDAS